MAKRLGMTLAIGLAAPGMGAFAQDQGAQATTSADAGSIVVSCYRGPLRETIWDYPHVVFIDSLVAYGYSYVEATALAERLCDDVTLVGDNAALAAATSAAILASPPGRR